MNTKCSNLNFKTILYWGIGILMLFLATLGAKSGCAPSRYPMPVPIGVFHNANERSASQDVVIQGQIAFLIATDGEFEETGGRLSSIDVSDPSKPQEIGFGRLVGLHPAGIAIHQNYVYVVSQGETPGISYFEIFDVSLPNTPRPVGILNLNAVLIAVAIKDGIAYLSDWLLEDILVIDVSDPTNPTYIRSVDMGFHSLNIYIHDNLAFLAMAGVGLSVLDITTPQEPVFLSTLNTGGGAVADVTAKGQYVYIPNAPASDINQLFVVDASDPTQMEIVDSLEVKDTPWGVALENSVVAMTIQESLSRGFVLLVDISDPTSPQKGGSADVPDYGPQGPVVIQDDLVYVVSVGGLAIYQIVYE